MDCNHQNHHCAKTVDNSSIVNLDAPITRRRCIFTEFKTDSYGGFPNAAMNIRGICQCVDSTLYKVFEL